MTETINVIGLGYIGLPTALILAKNGFKVHGVDSNQDVIDSLLSAKVHIKEDGLEPILKDSLNRKNLTVSSSSQNADIFIITVPTPINNKKQPDVSFVMQAIKDISKNLKPGNLIMIESTCPVGTTYEVYNYLKKLGVDADKIEIAYCPERVLPGKIIHELINNDRIVGGIKDSSTKLTKNFLNKFIKGDIVTTSSNVAEMAKLAENSFRDVNIAFANELSIICENLNIDVWELIKLTNLHPRVDILNPSVGVGGHCIAVDPWFIVNSDEENSKLIKQARIVNLNKTEWVIEKVINEANTFKNKFGRIPNLCCLGLAYKPDIDDLRESPALQIYQVLSKNFESVSAVDPNITPTDDIKLTSIEEAKETSDIFLLLVPHKEFSNLLVDAKILNFCSPGKH